MQAPQKKDGPTGEYPSESFRHTRVLNSRVSATYAEPAASSSAARVGVVQRDLAEYMLAALEMPELRLRDDAMLPRVDVVAVPDDCSAADAARRMAESGRKRLPVYHATIDQPLGVVHAIDVANALAGDGATPPLAPSRGAG